MNPEPKRFKIVSWLLLLLLPLWWTDDATSRLMWPFRWLIRTPVRLMYSPFTIVWYIGGHGIVGIPLALWYTLSGCGDW